jgi:hypothetical protein
MTAALFLSGDTENAPRFPHPHSPGEDYGTNVQRGLTLTLHLVQEIGQVSAPLSLLSYGS